MTPISRRGALRARRLAVPALAVLLLLGAVRAGRGEEMSTGPEPVGAPEAAVRARLERWRAGPRGGAGLAVLDPLLAERIRQLRATAPSFDRAWRELDGSGTPLVIGTAEQLREYLPRSVRESSAWAGITVSWGSGGDRLARSAVAIRVEWLRELHASFGNSDAAFLAALDGLIIHEVYGHLVPVVERRSATYTCPDPRAGERLVDSCVGRRELALLAERGRNVEY